MRACEVPDCSLVAVEGVSVEVDLEGEGSAVAPESAAVLRNTDSKGGCGLVEFVLVSSP